MRLFVVDYEGGLYRYLSPLAWLLSDAPFWGVQIGRRRFVHVSILQKHGFPTWRRGNPA